MFATVLSFRKLREWLKNSNSLNRVKRFEAKAVATTSEFPTLYFRGIPSLERFIDNEDDKEELIQVLRATSLPSLEVAEEIGALPGRFVLIITYDMGKALSLESCSSSFRVHAALIKQWETLQRADPIGAKAQRVNFTRVFRIIFQQFYDGEIVSATSDWVIAMQTAITSLTNAEGRKEAFERAAKTPAPRPPPVLKRLTPLEPLPILEPLPVEQQVEVPLEQQFIELRDPLSMCLRHAAGVNGIKLQDFFVALPAHVTHYRNLPEVNRYMQNATPALLTAFTRASNHLNRFPGPGFQPLSIIDILRYPSASPFAAFGRLVGILFRENRFLANPATRARNRLDSNNQQIEVIHAFKELRMTLGHRF